MKILISFFLLLLSFSMVQAQECLNIKFKLRGYFYAGSNVADPEAPGGHYEDDNRPGPVDQDIYALGKKGTFELIALTDHRAEIAGGVEGFKVLLINLSDTVVKLEAQDSRLALKRQVFDQGSWKDIEYLPSSWCGNSYHHVYLQVNEFWNFTAPCFQGRREGMFRFELTMAGGKKIYSNEFPGSYNPKQLRKEQGHKSAGIMDPYNN